MENERIKNALANRKEQFQDDRYIALKLDRVIRDVREIECEYEAI